MSTILLLVMMVGAPSTAKTLGDAPVASVLQEPTTPLVIRETVMEHAEGAGEAMAMVHERITALPVARQEAMAKQAAFILNNCPYNRASVQIVRTLELATADWEEQSTLRDALANHRSVLEALGVQSMEHPTSGYLETVKDGGRFLSDADLSASSDPVADTAATVAEIQRLVEAMPPETMEALKAARKDINKDIWNLWAFKPAIIGYRAELNIMLEGSISAAQRHEAEQLVALLDQFMSMYC